jgi:predicted Kef-type K+ transport protein
MTLGLIENPVALAGVPLVVAALLLVRGLPVAALRRELARTHLLAVSLLQATSLPFLLTVSQIGIEMGLLERTTAAALVAAEIVSVLIFPPHALRLLAFRPEAPSGAEPKQTTIKTDRTA